MWRVVLTNVVYTNHIEHAMYGASCSRTVPMHSEHEIFNWARDSLIPIDLGSRLLAPKSWSNHQNLLSMPFFCRFHTFFKVFFNCSNTIPAVHELKLKLNGEFFRKKKFIMDDSCGSRITSNHIMIRNSQTQWWFISHDPVYIFQLHWFPYVLTAVFFVKYWNHRQRHCKYTKCTRF